MALSLAGHGNKRCCQMPSQYAVGQTSRCWRQVRQGLFKGAERPYQCCNGCPVLHYHYGSALKGKTAAAFRHTSSSQHLYEDITSFHMETWRTHPDLYSPRFPSAVLFQQHFLWGTRIHNGRYEREEKHCSGFYVHPWKCVKLPCLCYTRTPLCLSALSTQKSKCRDKVTLRSGAFWMSVLLKSQNWLSDRSSSHWNGNELWVGSELTQRMIRDVRQIQLSH